MSAEEVKAEKIAALKVQIAGIKQHLNLRDGEGVRAAKGNPEFGKSVGFKTRWQKGHCPNPGGKPKTRVKFWNYIARFLDMTMPQVDAIVEEDMTLAELGAKRFALKVAEGRWPALQEVLNRELGRPSEGLGDTDADRGPKLITLPFRYERGG